MVNSWQLLLNGVGAGASAAMLAFGFALIFGATRIFHFAYAVTYLGAGYVFFELAVERGWPFPLAAIVALAAAGVLGGMLWLLLYRPLLHRGVDTMGLFLVSLGVVIVFQAFISIGWSGNVRRVPSTFLSRFHVVGGGYFTNLQVLGVVFAIIVVTFGALLYTRTHLGIAARAVGADHEIAGVLGINVDRTRLVLFVVASVIGAIPALLLVTDVGVTPGIGFHVVLIAVIATFVGGIDSPLGAALAGFGISLVQNLSVLMFAPKWQTVIAFAVLFAFVALRPQGIFGSVAEIGT